MPGKRRLVKYALGVVLAGAGLYILFYAFSTPMYLASIEGAISALVGIFLLWVGAVVGLTKPSVGGFDEVGLTGSETQEQPVQPITDATLTARRYYNGVTMGLAPTFIDPRMRDEPVNKRRD